MFGHHPVAGWTPVNSLLNNPPSTFLFQLLQIPSRSFFDIPVRLAHCTGFVHNRFNLSCFKCQLMVNISHYGLYPIVIFWLYTHVILFTCIFSCVSFNAVSLFGVVIMCRWDCWLSDKLHEVVAVSVCGSVHGHEFISPGLSLMLCLTVFRNLPVNFFIKLQQWYKTNNDWSYKLVLFCVIWRTIQKLWLLNTKQNYQWKFYGVFVMETDTEFYCTLAAE